MTYYLSPGGTLNLTDSCLACFQSGNVVFELKSTPHVETTAVA